MNSSSIDRLIEFVTGPQLVWGVLWLGLVLVTLTLMALMVTRWGQSRPLGKCVALSLLSHALLATYAMTIEIVGASPREPLVRATIVDEAPPALQRPQQEQGETAGEADGKPWERMPFSTPAPHDALLDRPEMQNSPPSERAPTELSPLLPGEMPQDAVAESEAASPQPDALKTDASLARGLDATDAESIEAPAAMRQEAKTPAVAEEMGLERAASNRLTPALSKPTTSSGLPEALRSAAPELPPLAETPASVTQTETAPRLANVPVRTASPLAPEMESPAARRNDAERRMSGPAALSSLVGRGVHQDAEKRLNEALARSHGGIAPPALAPRRTEEGESALPPIYRLRRAPKRAEIAERQGGSATTEQAVKAALKWLAEHQHTDGRWDASVHGAGRELKVGGQDRKGAGEKSDTGVTGLALLAFLGAGNTHLDGEYSDTVARGVAFLLDIQASNGNLGGEADRFAFMYCHGMATLALSEVYAMTGDDRLQEPVRRAIDYTLSAQNPTGGGWRYGIGDPAGDTSQLGWQLMALKSAELAGIDVPAKARQGMIRFLKSVASGRHGGLASYRVGERPTVSMTAEALVCRQFLGLARSNPASDEAGNFILTQLPGRGQPNFYYWYYATLGMFQLQGDHWRRWNDALAGTLVARQQTEGSLAGSWDDDDVWGGHGGRVYTTAMGALCLEVYYRFLPLYVRASALDDGNSDEDGK